MQHSSIDDEGTCRQILIAYSIRLLSAHLGPVLGTQLGVPVRVKVALQMLPSHLRIVLTARFNSMSVYDCCFASAD